MTIQEQYGIYHRMWTKTIINRLPNIHKMAHEWESLAMAEKDIEQRRQYMNCMAGCYARIVQAENVLKRRRGE